MTWIRGAKRRAQAIEEHTGQQDSPIAGRLCRSSGAASKKGKNHFPCGRACNALMRLFKLYPVSVIYQALMSTRLEYGNVTYQEMRKRCEQIIWAKENNQVPNIGNDQRVAVDYLSPTHANIRNNYR